MELIDTHTHLDGFVRSGNLAEVLDRARAAGVVAMIATGTGPDDWGLYAELAERYPGTVYYTAGLHPCSVDAAWKDAFDQLESFTQRETAPVAIGETGLDRFHLPKDADAAKALLALQEASFRAHLKLAAGAGLPLVVHSRNAVAECIGIIDESGFDWSRVVFHCFSDGPEVMTEIERRGGRGSFTGIVTYKNAENVRQAAIVQGLDRTMVETDAPYLAPDPHRGKPNEPAFIVHTAARLAACFGVTPASFAEISTRNAREFFGLRR